MELAAFEKSCGDIVRSGKENVIPDAVAKPQEAARKKKSSVPPTKSAGCPEQKEKKPVSEHCNDEKLLMVLYH